MQCPPSSSGTNESVGDGNEETPDAADVDSLSSILQDTSSTFWTGLTDIDAVLGTLWCVVAWLEWQSLHYHTCHFMA